MTGEDGPVHHRELDLAVDIPATLEQGSIEYLDVDEHRTIVIFQHAILMVISTIGPSSASEAFDVELWNPPLHDPNPDPNTILTVFSEEFLSLTDTTRTSD